MEIEDASIARTWLAAGSWMRLVDRARILGDIAQISGP
jgi:hypothetical protein